MKKLNQYIQEKFIINKNTSKYHYFPENFNELKEIIIKKIENDGQGIKKNPLYLPDINFEKIDDLSNLLAGLDIEYVDVTNLNINHITNFSGMFSMCQNLIKVIGLETWKIPENSDLSFMFYKDKKLEYADTSDWNTSNCDTTGMFGFCDHLQN